MRQSSPASGSPHTPAGLGLFHEVVTPREEKALIAEIEAMGLPPFIHEPNNPRCTRAFGWDYCWPDEAITPAEPIPPQFHLVCDAAARFARVEPEEIIQCMVIRYDPGAVIQWHCDKAVWEHIVGLSLGNPVTMGLRRPVGDGFETTAVELPPRSMYLLTGEARHVYQHSLPPIAGTRWSMTFRTFSARGKQLRDRVLAGE